MDLSTLAVSQESQTLTLKHPSTGEEIAGATIDLLSSDTNKYKAAVEKLKKLDRDKKADKTARNAEEGICDLLALVSTGCNIEINGKKVKHSEKAMKDIFFNPEYTWIADQVLSFVNNRANFIQASLTV